MLSAVGYRDITGYNAAVAKGEIEPPPEVDPEDNPYEHMPYIVVVVDELNDLMMVAARDVEESITGSPRRPAPSASISSSPPSGRR